MCACDAMVPPFWNAPNKARSLSPSLCVCVSLSLSLSLSRSRALSRSLSSLLSLSLSLSHISRLPVATSKHTCKHVHTYIRIYKKGPLG